jgi:hypothetical protein
VSKRAERLEFSGLSPLRWQEGTPWWTIALFLAALALGTVGAQVFHHVLMFALPFALAFLATAWPAKIALGEDGVSHHRLGFTRFTPYAKVVKCEVIQRIGGRLKDKKTPVVTAVRLTLEDGKHVDLPMGQGILAAGSPTAPAGTLGHFGAFHPDAWKLRKAIEERVQEVRSLAEPTDLAVSLMRGEQSVEGWRAKIAEAAPIEAQYRDASKEALWRVVEDPQQPRDARAGAAMALRNDLGIDGRERLRIVATECESPKLRIALETALDAEDEQRIDEALENVSRQSE